MTVRLAEDPAYRGSALYRQGDYEKAVEDFKRAPGADASYNRGNALARLSRYEEAISAYDQALELRPGMEDALANKAAVEALLNQQQKRPGAVGSAGRSGSVIGKGAGVVGSRRSRETGTGYAGRFGRQW